MGGAKKKTECTPHWLLILMTVLIANSKWKTGLKLTFPHSFSTIFYIILGQKFEILLYKEMAKGANWNLNICILKEKFGSTSSLAHFNSSNILLLFRYKSKGPRRLTESSWICRQNCSLSLISSLILLRGFTIFYVQYIITTIRGRVA